MPNLASAFKAEIARIARKEVRAETDALRKASSRYRAELAGLKRSIQALEQQRKRLSRASTATSRAAADSSEEQPSFRFRAKGLAKHRQRLGLSAEALGKLLGVSGQTIYYWEAGKARPRAAQMPAIAALRKLGKRTALAVLATR
jgi:DNA-binding transcriptional regulator YiaG